MNCSSESPWRAWPPTPDGTLWVPREHGARGRYLVRLMVRIHMQFGLFSFLCMAKDTEVNRRIYWITKKWAFMQQSFLLYYTLLLRAIKLVFWWGRKLKWPCRKLKRSRARKLTSLELANTWFLQANLSLGPALKKVSMALKVGYYATNDCLLIDSIVFC